MLSFPIFGWGLIISSFRLNKSFWAPCWAGCLHLKAERSSFSSTSRVWSWPQGLPDSPGILGGAWPGIYVQIWDSSFHRSLGMASIIVVTPGSTHLPCLLTERGDRKSRRASPIAVSGPVSMSTVQAGAGEWESQDLSQLSVNRVCRQRGLFSTFYQTEPKLLKTLR